MGSRSTTAGGTGGVPTGEGERRIGDGGSSKRSSSVRRGGLEGAASLGVRASVVSPVVGDGLLLFALASRDSVRDEPSAMPEGGVLLGLSLGDGRR